MTIFVAVLDVFFFARGFLPEDFRVGAPVEEDPFVGDVCIWSGAESNSVWEVHKAVYVSSSVCVLFDAQGVEEVLVCDEFKIADSGNPVIVRRTVLNLGIGEPKPRDVCEGIGHFYRKECVNFVSYINIE